MTGFLDREAWRWTAPPPAAPTVGGDTLDWTCAGATDFWRVTQGHPSKHDGQAYLTPARGDFVLEGTVSAPLREQFDQVGFLLEAGEERWVKFGVELDGPAWLGAVHTRGESDWSFARCDGLPLRLRALRTGPTVTLAAQVAGAWTGFRVLHLPGPLSVGPYACAPRGPGFAATLSDGQLELRS